MKKFIYMHIKEFHIAIKLILFIVLIAYIFFNYMQ